MKQLLILTSTYLPNPGANGIITESVVNELVKRGYKISIIAIKNNTFEEDFEVINDIEIYRIPKSLYSQRIEKYSSSEKTLNKVFKKSLLLQRRFNNLINVFNFPDFDSDQVENILKKALELIREKKINSIIAFSKPFSNISALVKIQKNNKDIKSTAVFLDTINSIKRPKFLPQTFYQYLIDRSYLKITNTLSRSYIPINMKETFAKKTYFHQFIYYEMPSLSFFEKQEKKSIDNEHVIKIAYSGTLDNLYRNPKVFLESIKKISELGTKIHIGIRGKNNLKEGNIQHSNINISNYGLSTREEVFNSYRDSDFLVNISNLGNQAIPSKIFELFSTGKPIINYVKDEDDYTLNYFEKYPLHFNFFEEKDFEFQTKKLIEFMKMSKGKEVDFETIFSIYKDNTIESFIDILEEHI